MSSPTTPLSWDTMGQLTDEEVERTRTPDLDETFRINNLDGDLIVRRYDGITSVGWAVSQAKAAWPKPQEGPCKFRMLKGAQVLRDMGDKLHDIFVGQEEGDRLLTFVQMPSRSKQGGKNDSEVPPRKKRRLLGTG